GDGADRGGHRQDPRPPRRRRVRRAPTAPLALAGRAAAAVTHRRGRHVARRSRYRVGPPPSASVRLGPGRCRFPGPRRPPPAEGWRPGVVEVGMSFYVVARELVALVLFAIVLLGVRAFLRRGEADDDHLDEWADHLDFLR